MMKRTFLGLSLLVVLVLLLAGLGPSLALDRQTRLDVMSAVVQVSLVKIEKGEVYYLPWGSGTIVSADGLILTNCHVADPIRYGFPPEEIPAYDYLGVALTIRSDRPPQLAYLATVEQADPRLDLAVIRIRYKTDRSEVKASTLNLPYVKLGDSDELVVGDDLNIFGYPGIGGETVTFTKGVVSGFTMEAGVDGPAWIKTDASIAGGNSGGTAVDEQGLLVGVPTRGGDVDCRVVADTNGDGRLDNKDSCVPVGGYINNLRPVNLAKPLIEAARQGLPDPNKTGEQKETPTPTGQPKLSNLFFSPGVNEFDQPTTVVTSLPSGSRSLYLFFDYENMSPDRLLEMKLAFNGKDLPDWGLPPGPWRGGERGMWWIGWNDADFADGNYKLALYVDNSKMAEAEIRIGGMAERKPTFSNILFSLEKTAQDQPVEPAVLFPAGTKRLLAFFDYQNMSSANKWTRTWLADGKEVLTKDESWTKGQSGSYVLELTSSKGLAAGAYRLNLYIDGKLAALSNFWVTGQQGSSASFAPVVFAEGVDRRGNPVGVAKSFPSGLEELHAFSDYSGMEDGLAFQVNWYVDGQKVIESPFDWDGGESGTWHDYLYSTRGTLPDAEYGVELLVEGQVLQKGTTAVGTGVRPTPTPSPQDGVQVQGTITDLDTNRPIAGAIFLVLKPGITLDTFQWTDDELYTSAETDRQGFYRLPDLLRRGECYTMIIGAQGYWPYGEDDVCVAKDAPSVVDLPVQLEKK